MNTALTDPFDRVKTYSIGFDRMFDRLLDDSRVTTQTYPPYNIVKEDAENFMKRLNYDLCEITEDIPESAIRRYNEKRNTVKKD